MQLDLSSLADVKAFVNRAKAMPHLDILVCNAGIMCPLEHTLTDDGMEIQFQVLPIHRSLDLFNTQT
jgi:WW domain-containing oxidoreductase